MGVAFSPISAKSSVDNAIAAEGTCAGECYTRYETAKDANKCDKLWTETSLTAPAGFTEISIMEDAVASLQVIDHKLHRDLATAYSYNIYVCSHGKITVHFGFIYKNSKVRFFIICSKTFARKSIQKLLIYVLRYLDNSTTLMK